MAAKKDWLSTARELILAMVDDWIAVCTPKQAAWSITSPALTELVTRRAAARTALDTAKNETTRTPAKRLCLLAWSLAA
jgi:hypothetical protein